MHVYFLCACIHVFLNAYFLIQSQLVDQDICFIFLTRCNWLLLVLQQICLSHPGLYSFTLYPLAQYHGGEIVVLQDTEMEWVVLILKYKYLVLLVGLPQRVKYLFYRYLGVNLFIKSWIKHMSTLLNVPIQSNPYPNFCLLLLKCVSKVKLCTCPKSHPYSPTQRHHSSNSFSVSRIFNASFHYTNKM